MPRGLLYERARLTGRRLTGTTRWRAAGPASAAITPVSGGEGRRRIRLAAVTPVGAALGVLRWRRPARCGVLDAHPETGPESTGRQLDTIGTGADDPVPVPRSGTAELPLGDGCLCLVRFSEAVRILVYLDVMLDMLECFRQTARSVTKRKQSQSITCPGRFGLREVITFTQDA